MKLTGYKAIEAKENDGAIVLCKHTDPTEAARAGITIDEAREIAREDASLIYAEVVCAGWTDGDGSGHEGYNVADFFTPSGRYLGADEHGIEPIFAAA